MPAALERKLKRQVAGKNWSEERKDAYVYGVLRKTGWKPSHQKKMSNPERIVRLGAINSRLDKIIQFQDDDDDNLRKKAAIGALGAGTVGAGVTGGLYAAGARKMGVAWSKIPAKFGQNVASVGKGGVGDFGAAVKAGAQAAGSGIKAGYQAAAPGIKSGAQQAWTATKGLLRKIRLHQLNEKLIEFAGNPKDPGAGQFGGNDPGIQSQKEKDAAQVSALQRLKLKIAKLRGMGLYNY